MEIKTALILCAGFGKRLNPLTLDKPKPLLKIKDVSLLENTILLIKKMGIKKIILNTYYLKNQIDDFLKQKRFNISINIVEDGDKILNTGGGILNMINTSVDQDFIIFNPDTIWNESYIACINNMEKYYLLNKISNILLVVNKKSSFDQKLKGDFILENNKIKNNEKNNYIYTGCQILNRNLFSFTDKKVFSIIEIWDDLIKKNNLYGFESKSKFYHLTNLEIYQRLLKN